nr:sialic acid-binding Ig-like lectin 13 isoform X1 [Pogona vitticeps]
MGHFLEFLSLGLVSMCLLWKGVRCVHEEYTIHAPDTVSVQEGLCVIIPCNFMYDTNAASSGSPLYGYWYEEGKWTEERPAVATNNKMKPIEDYARGRFNLSEEVENGNCSLIIRDAKETDEKKYFFRMEKEPDAKFSYIRPKYVQPFVNVTKLENPKIQMPGNLRAGHQVNITCIAPESCALKRPHVSWKGLPDQVKTGTRVTQANNFKDHISVFSFIPSAADDGQELTCQVTYGEEGQDPLYRNETVYLNVSYAPQKLRINAEVIRSNTSLQNYTNHVRLTVEECDTVVLRCEMEGNPLPIVTWQKIPQSSRFNETLDDELRLTNVTMQDEGEYECQAQNTEGSASVTFRLYVTSRGAWSPTVINGVIVGLVVIGVIMLIVAAILMYKKCEREGKVVIDVESYTEQKRICSINSPVAKECNSIGRNQEEGKNVSQAQEKMGKGTDEIYSEPDSVNYVSVIFIPREPHQKVTSENPPTEYAEVKKSQSSDFTRSQADI